MSELGPCVICGDTGYNLSCGGPTICPKCDCGHFDAATVEMQAKVIADLRAQLDEVSADYFAECDKVKGLELKLGSASVPAQQAPLREAVKEATQAQHFDTPKGEPARFVRNGVLETCQCRDCAAISNARDDCACGGGNLSGHDSMCPENATAALPSTECGEGK